MRCCRPSRRELLRWAAIVGSTALLPVIDTERAYAAAARSDLLAIPHNAEIVTLTPTSVIVTWYTGIPGFTGDQLRPSPQDTQLRIGTNPLRLRTVLHHTARTPYHYAEVHGLEPGRTYYYQALSNGVPALPAVNATGNPLGVATTTLDGLRDLAGVLAFTTPQPPPGRHLFTLALANDVHMGETVAGLIKTVGPIQLPPGITQRDGEPPYAEVMCQAMVHDAMARGADKLLVAGDVTSEAQPDHLRQARTHLDRFGRYRTDYFLTRGNHDRPHAGADYASCRISAVDPTKRDCFKDFFDPHDPTWFSTELFGMRLIGLDTYDKPGNGGDNGALSRQQFAWSQRELARDRDRPTLVFGHHPMTLASDIVNLEPFGFDMNLKQAREIRAMYGKAPGVFFHHQGHTHRNYRSASSDAKQVVFQEVAATKEYPGGFSLLRVHEGGYAMNFYKTRAPLAREWSERTRGEYLGVGLSAFYMSGSIADRNYVVRRDLSGLHTASTKPTMTRTATSV
ncbi:MAG TPA: metallophosphoesterase family protein [Mycobacteriales bacterium]|nr:metallophosphoesterase family protein [Mycobacteriales bacterium]